MTAAELFPELANEQRHLAYARACRDDMVARLRAVDPSASADEITAEYVEVTVADALHDLSVPGAGDFFGRITDEERQRWYIGRRHIESPSHDPVVVDWRAPIAAPFYRATGVDPLGLQHRRRFTLTDGQLSAYLDEALDHPDAGTAATGVPDPVLAEIGAARTGAMRDIVATIQAEQDVVIRAPLDQCLIVQGGPGTGKTAVGLHRAAYLLFEHRRVLARSGVLVVGPNRVFLDYIANVLPSLGERTVTQRTVLDLCVPKVPVTAADNRAAGMRKGSAEMLAELEAATVGHLRRPVDDLRVPFGARTITFPADLLNGWLDTALDGRVPVNKRRDSLPELARQHLLRETGRDDVWERLPGLRSALTKAWPAQDPIRLVDNLLTGPRGKRRAWTAADQLLVDEANSLLNGTPFTFGHVIVDEAQDLSAVALRVIGRRTPRGSITVLGDLAQSTTPAGQRSWAGVVDLLGADRSTIAELTIGYRVPGPILDVANRLLPFTDVATRASTSVRLDGVEPAVHVVTDVPGGVAESVALIRHRHHSVAVVAPFEDHEAISAAMRQAGLRSTDHVHELAADQIPLFSPDAVKGLEFDGVVVANAHAVFAGSALGARLLYVALTRAVQVVHLVADRPPPVELRVGHR